MKYTLIIFLAFIVSCNTTKNKKEPSLNTSKTTETIVLKVNAEQVNCEGAHGSQKCLQIKELGKDNSWQNLYEGISGFDYQPGYIYKLQVEKTTLQSPPQDVSAIQYKLISVLNKKAPITEEMMEKFETLTVTKIENGKDGYTATLTDQKGGLYVCTISIPNLEDNYVRLNIGDKVKIAGEYAESHPVQIFPTKISKVE